MTKKILFILTTIFCMAFFCACSAEESKPEYDITLGTYRYIREDGKVSEIILTKDTIKYVNVDFELCKELAIIDKHIAEAQTASAEGRELTEAEVQAIIDEVEAYDFYVHANKEYAYIICEDLGFSFNLAAVDENGNKIPGLKSTYHVEKKQLGFDEYYTLVEE